LPRHHTSWQWSSGCAPSAATNPLAHERSCHIRQRVLAPERRRRALSASSFPAHCRFRVQSHVRGARCGHSRPTLARPRVATGRRRQQAPCSTSRGPQERDHDQHLSACAQRHGEERAGDGSRREVTRCDRLRRAERASRRPDTGAIPAQYRRTPQAAGTLTAIKLGQTAGISLVRGTGLEPARLAATEPKSAASAIPPSSRERVPARPPMWRAAPPLSRVPASVARSQHTEVAPLENNRHGRGR
jgi:hypothetical protein